MVTVAKPTFLERLQHSTTSKCTIVHEPHTTTDCIRVSTYCNIQFIPSCMWLTLSPLPDLSMCIFKISSTHVTSDRQSGGSAACIIRSRSQFSQSHSLASAHFTQRVLRILTIWIFDLRCTKFGRELTKGDKAINLPIMPSILLRSIVLPLPRVLLEIPWCVGRRVNMPSSCSLSHDLWWKPSSAVCNTRLSCWWYVSRDR